jgi:anthranilate phosphoribosyltransferase
MTPQEALSRLIAHQDLSREEMLSIVRGIMAGEITPVQTAAILIGLRVKVETVVEIAAAAEVMRELSTKVEVGELPHLVDTCGTGGDGLDTFNISTASAFVAAASGARVAKHGGRSVSSSTGSADVLESLGVHFATQRPEHCAHSIREIGVGFMFAPNHHSAMKFAAPVRRELGVRTLFNILGPLTNPAGARNQLMGVFHRDLVLLQAQVLQLLGSRHVMVVHGEDGLDEISLSRSTWVAELKNGQIAQYSIEPVTFGMDPAPLDTIRVRSTDESKAMLLAVLADRPGPARDIVCLNAGAAIYVSGCASSLVEGVERARAAIASGGARAKLDQLVEFSRLSR